MRLGSFIAGGMLGAAVVYTLNSRMSSRLMSVVRSSMSEMKSGDATSSRSGQSSNSNHSSADSSQIDLDGLKKFKQLIKQDSQLKQTILDIINQDEHAPKTAATNPSQH